MLILIWTLLVLAALVLFFREKYSKLYKLQVQHRPAMPLAGSMLPVLLRKEHYFEVLMKTYRAFPEDRIVGYYEFMKPQILIRDLELVKKIMVKDFEHFVDRLDEESEDPLRGRSLLMLRGDEWKDMRSTLSPAFTSSKIRLMIPLMIEVGELSVKSIAKKIKESKDGYIDVEFKELSTRFANDIIASCAFGLKIGSHDDDNQFYKVTTQLLDFPFAVIVKFFIFRAFPWLQKIFGTPSMSDPKAYDFIKDLVLDNMKQREERGIMRNDMIHLLMQAKKGQLKHELSKDQDAGFATVEESEVGKRLNKTAWSDSDLVAQAALFLLAGYETVSIQMAFMAHEIAVNPDVQDKLVREIREHDDKTEKFDYNSILNLKYLDMVVSEVLRLWPAVSFSTRCCVKEYNLGKPNEKATRDYVLSKGDVVTIPTWGFHLDPKYFPNPTKFDPERFSEENRHTIKPFTYMPFGNGPRNCIGSRFALSEIKVLTYQLLRRFQLSPCEKTCIPARLVTDGVSMKIKGGAWVRITLRE